MRATWLSDSVNLKVFEIFLHLACAFKEIGINKTFVTLDFPLKMLGLYLLGQNC